MYCHREMETLFPAAVGKDRTVITCCSDECVHKSERFMDFFDRHKTHFLILLAVAAAVFFSGVLILDGINKAVGSAVFSAGFGLFGFDVFLFPFATPQTFDLLGIRGTAALARVLGAAIVAASPFLAYAILHG